jgi:hypothetical protein
MATIVKVPKYNGYSPYENEPMWTFLKHKHSKKNLVKIEYDVDLWKYGPFLTTYKSITFFCHDFFRIKKISRFIVLWYILF